MADDRDILFMREAINEAKKALDIDEVPVGAVAVAGGKVIAGAHNIREKTNNPLGHAEILLLQKLSSNLSSWRLNDVSVYVTCEPCLMCAGALLQARVGKLVFGCLDPMAGACGSLYNVVQDERLGRTIPLLAGVLENECAGLLSDFFRSKRGGK